MTFLSNLTDLPENDRNIYTDFDRRYQQTYLQCTYPDGVHILYFRGRDGTQLHFTDITNQTAFIWNNTLPDIEITTFLPKTGYYNVEGGIIYVYKFPHRQYKRSFCTGIYAMTGDTPRSIESVALAIVKADYVELDEVTHLLFAKIAISKKFAIQSKNNKVYLYYKQYPIALLDFVTKTISMVQQNMLQEVKDLFQYTGVKRWKLN